MSEILKVSKGYLVEGELTPEEARKKFPVPWAERDGFSYMILLNTGVIGQEKSLDLKSCPEWGSPVIDEVKSNGVIPVETLFICSLPGEGNETCKYCRFRGGIINIES